MFSKITPKGYMLRNKRVNGFIDLYCKNILENDLILREDEFLGLLDKKYDTTMHKCKVYHNPFQNQPCFVQPVFKCLYCQQHMTYVATELEVIKFVRQFPW